MHWSTRNRLVVLKWKLLKPFNAVKMVYRRWLCYWLNHEEFPEGTRTYCTRCYQWREKGVWRYYE